MKAWIAFCAAALLFSAAAGRASPSSARGTVIVKERIDAPVDRVWALVGDFAGVVRWNPLLIDCKVETIDGQVFRTAYFDGWWIKERLDRRDPRGHRLDYSVVASSRPAVVGARATITLVASGAQTTQMQWSAMSPVRAGAPPGSDADLANYYRIRIGHLRAILSGSR